MKKIYLLQAFRKFFAVVAIIVLCASSSFSQLSGTYTIGGSTPDYPDFTTAIDSLTASGINGPVIFNVRNGTYAEKLLLDPITGTNSINTITFQSELGDSSAVILTDPSTTTTANNYLIKFNGADFVHFHQMTFERSGTATNARILEITGSSQYNIFSNNFFKGVAATTSTVNNTLVYSAAAVSSNDEGNIFKNNYFLNGSYGFYYYGPSATILEMNTEISDNIFEKQYVRCITLYYQLSPKVSRNIFNVTSTIASFYTIYCYNCDKQVKIDNNVIKGVPGGYGIYMSLCDGDSLSPTPGLIYNNMIQVGGTGTAYGIYINGCTRQCFYYNSINITSTSTTAGRAFYLAGTTTLKVVIQNNVFANHGGGHAYYITGTAVNGITLSDYNDLYTSGSTLAVWNTSSANSLTTLTSISNKDLSSVSVDPNFYTSTDLHSSATGINNLALPVAGITIDVDSETRSASTPDIGADEFTPLNDNVGVIAVSSPVIASCGNAAAPIKVVVKNFGSVTQSNIAVHVDVTGSTTLSLNGTVPGLLTIGASDTLTFVTTLNTLAGGTFVLTCNTSLATDQFTGNDTLVRSFQYQPTPAAPTVTSPQTFCAGSVVLLSNPAPNELWSWYNAATGGTLLHIGSTPFTPNISSNTTYYLESRADLSSTSCLRITECALTGTNNFIELQNCSSDTIDATGWKVALSGSNTAINTMNTITWTLGTFLPGEIQYKSDVAADHYWGSAISWAVSQKGWAVIMDNAGFTRDFVVWGWPSATIQSMSVTIGGFPFVPGSNWSGNGASTCTSGSVTRQGNIDHNDSTDFICAASSKNVLNAGMFTPFVSCGSGACASPRVPVSVLINPLPVVHLGNDTVVVAPNTVTLNAGAGGTNYLWSTGATTQTIVVTTTGTYSVGVTGSNNCVGHDTILVTVLSGIQEIDDLNNIFISSRGDEMTLLFQNHFKQVEIKILDLQGRELMKSNFENTLSGDSKSISLANLNSGLYFIQIKSGENFVQKKFFKN